MFVFVQLNVTIASKIQPGYNQDLCLDGLVSGCGYGYLFSSQILSVRENRSLTKFIYSLYHLSGTGLNEVTKKF